ncbi:VanZ family protein [Lacticaseibacillus daqingensis]|uniref:VanZ family protein n=1 Tax=Lacticaseibacillus daqingensis TaxID=2486014 RepID=UPI000F7859F4|nr:VanZ family protein [Lacticaseibacillus daqingensis]
MSAYLYPVKMAVLAFPLLALVLALPFMVAQYRRYGSFVFWRAVVLYTFVFYLISAYFLIMLPLPSVASVAKLTTPRYNLVPFTALREFWHTTVFNPLDPHTWLAAMKQPGFIQPVFNVVLTIPFGVYLRYYFKRPLWQIVAMSFGLSLFFELTQLSGLYGYYPRPYRLFDVDDLILNTTGGVLGGLMAPGLMRVFPSRDEMDAASFAKGTHVTLMRRFVAFVIDNVVAVGVVTVLFDLLVHLLGGDSLLAHVQLATAVPLILVFIVWPVFTGGQTPGKALVKIKIVNEDGSPVRFWRLVLREVLLYGVAFQSLGAFNYFFGEVFSKFHRTDINFILTGIFGLITGFLLVNFLWEFATRDNRYFYDVWAKTKQVSTIDPHKV